MIFLHAQRLRLDPDDVHAGKGAVFDVRSTPDPSTHDITLRRNRRSFEVFIGDASTPRFGFCVENASPRLRGSSFGEHIESADA